MQTSPIPPSVLLLDDGELDGVDRILRGLDADVLRLIGAQIAGEIQQPRDLLVTSGRRTFNMPTLEVPEGADSPIWASVHNQDFLPLRQRMRALGVNFLVHSALDLETLQLFLLQMLYQGGERRASKRLPLGVTVTLRAGGLVELVRLIEVSSESCQILSSQPVSSDVPVVLVLPPVITGGDPCELRGTPARSSVCQTRTGDVGYSTVLRYQELSVRASAALKRMARGDLIGTRLSQLAGAPSGRPVSLPPPAPSSAKESPIAVAPEATDVEAESDRRGAPRHVYDRRVQLLELCDANVHNSALGRDLSLDGIRVDGYPELESGTKVTLALYAGRREEPLVVSASVVRSVGCDEVAFRFEELTAQQKRGLDKLVEGRERLESLDRAGPIVMTKLVEKA